jgi:hypothetical protein
MNSNLKYKLSYILLAIVAIVTYILFIRIYKDVDLLELLEKKLVSQQVDIEVSFCGKEISYLERFIDEFSSRTKTRDIVNSRPTSFFRLEFKIDNNFDSFFLARDSKEKDLFWIYPSELPENISPLAYLKAGSLGEQIDADCRTVEKDAWIYGYFRG